MIRKRVSLHALSVCAFEWTEATACGGNAESTQISLTTLLSLQGFYFDTVVSMSSRLKIGAEASGDCTPRKASNMRRQPAEDTFGHLCELLMWRVSVSAKPGLSDASCRHEPSHSSVMTRRSR